jgi:1,4-alpha-glucan branching enzyme
MVNGYWIPVLHSHLPFVRHPEYEFFLEEHWLFEAISESYIPLLMAMGKMVSQGIDFRLAISLSPPLMEMLSDQYLMVQYEKYLDKLISLSEKEQTRLKGDRDFFSLACFYHKRFDEIKTFFQETLNSNVLNGYRHFNGLGKIEVITSCATHGFLPLLRENSKAVDVQISVAADSFRKHMGKSPEGIWLPECAYYDGIEDVLGKHGIKYFFLDARGLMEGEPVPEYSVYAPVYTKAGVAAFGREPRSSQQVWSAEEGYPGDFCYRDFYRDAGYDLDFNYIKPYISPDGARVFTGIKYYKITGKSDHKEPYDPDKAAAKTAEHAAHFYTERVEQARTLAPMMDRPPAIVSPYDAELFGHWWFEGPEFLYHVFGEMEEKGVIKAVTPSEYLHIFPQNQVISPCPSSWGDRGYYDVWLNEENDWIYRHLHHMADRMEDLAVRHVNENDPLKVRLLNQLTRELLLAQSSDWAFLMTTNTAREYSVKRTSEHIENFNSLLEGFLSGSIDVPALEMAEQKNLIFEDLDFRVFANT